MAKHFIKCGSVKRVTILCNKYTGHPKGFAYVEFEERASVETAMLIGNST